MLTSIKPCQQQSQHEWNDGKSRLNISYSHIHLQRRKVYNDTSFSWIGVRNTISEKTPGAPIRTLIAALFSCRLWCLGKQFACYRLTVRKTCAYRYYHALQSVTLLNSMVLDNAHLHAAPNFNRILSMCKTQKTNKFNPCLGWRSTKARQEPIQATTAETRYKYEKR